MHMFWDTLLEYFKLTILLTRVHVPETRESDTEYLKCRDIMMVAKHEYQNSIWRNLKIEENQSLETMNDDDGG